MFNLFRKDPSAKVDTLQQKQKLSPPFSRTLYVTVLSSFILFITIFYCLNQQTYPACFTQEKIPNLISKIVSSIHACIIFFFAILYLTQHIGIATWQKAIYFSAGYFIFDVCIIPFYTSGAKETLEMLLHHTIVLFVLLCYFKKNPRLVAQGLLCEITAPFLYSSWALIKAGQQDTLLFKVLSGCTLLGFALARVYNFTDIYKQLYKQKSQLYELFFFALIVLLNYYWFAVLLQKAYSLCIN